MWTYNYPNELYHYGVIGMKWGVRRYQNEDGTLTNAGKKRYNNDSDKLATAVAAKYKHIYEFHEIKSDMETKIGKDPKSITDADRREFAKRYNAMKFGYDLVNATKQSLTNKGYSKIDFEFLSEKNTGEQYVQAVLEDKLGNTYVSELYLGTHVINQ